MFKKEAIIMILLPASIILVAIIVVFFASAHLISPCKNELIGEHPSPDGKYKAVLFVRDCGATTVLSTQVSLLRLNAQLKNGSGNLFIADTDHGKIPSRQKGGPEVRIVWEGSKDIYIVHHENARVFKAEKKVNGINVNYKSLKNENDNKANEADVKKPVRPCRLEFHLARSLFADVIEDYIRIRNRQICKRFYSGYYVASPPIYLIAL